MRARRRGGREVFKVHNFRKDMAIKVVSANKRDKKQLLGWFTHYELKRIINNRVDCYLSHNSTIVAKDKNKIIGILQWYIKEEPDDGLTEFEEVFVSKEYRGRRIGALLVEYAIKSVKDYFKKLRIKPRKIFLFVSKNNKAARVLYEKFGFKKIANVGNLFHDREQELFYVLDLRK